uniref:Putative secreted protein n=1 Tax=Anopheles darlingi TaxID=43151 RepID=A0A2M4D8L6_ANODA
MLAPITVALICFWLLLAADCCCGTVTRPRVVSAYCHHLPPFDGGRRSSAQWGLKIKIIFLCFLSSLS